MPPIPPMDPPPPLLMCKQKWKVCGDEKPLWRPTTPASQCKVLPCGCIVCHGIVVCLGCKTNHGPPSPS